jgi:hypothetical protein
VAPKGGPPAATQTRGSTVQANGTNSSSSFSGSGNKVMTEFGPVYANADGSPMMRELANGLSIPTGPLQPIQLLQIYDFRLNHLEQDLKEVQDAITIANDASVADATQSFVCDTRSLSVCDATSPQCTQMEARITALEEENAALNEGMDKLMALFHGLKDDMLKMQTFAMETNMRVLQLALPKSSANTPPSETVFTAEAMTLGCN